MGVERTPAGAVGARDWLLRGAGPPRPGGRAGNGGVLSNMRGIIGRKGDVNATQLNSDGSYEVVADAANLGHLAVGLVFDGLPLESLLDGESLVVVVARQPVGCVGLKPVHER